MLKLLETQYIVLLIGSLLIGYVIHHIFKNKEQNENKNLLIPRVVSYMIPWIGSAVPYGKNPLKFIQECRKEYGEIFTLVLAGRTMTFILDPHVLPQIFKDKNFGTSIYFEEAIENGFGIHKSSVEKMSNQAKHPQKYLSGEHLIKLIEHTKIKFSDTILNKAKPNNNDSKEAWKHEHLYDFIARILWTSITESIFGKGFTEEDTWDDFHDFDHRLQILISGAPKIFLGAALKSREKLRHLFTKEKLFRENENDWVAYRNKEFLERLDQGQLMNIQISLVWAAVANTIPIAFWTVANIISTPHIKKQCEQEIEKFTKIDPITKQITFIDLDKFIYIDACITEALRHHTVALFIREAKEDAKIHLESLNQTYLIKKGENVAFYPHITHMDPEIYGNDAKEFNPSRFLPNNDGSKKTFMKNGREVKFYLLPFGTGSSLCPGRHYAREGIKSLVIYLLHYIDFKLHDKVPDADVRRAGLGVWDPVNDMKFEYRLKQHVQLD